MSLSTRSFGVFNPRSSAAMAQHPESTASKPRLYDDIAAAVKTPEQ